MPRGYSSSETSVHQMAYHFVWCPKYRRKVLEDKIAERLRQLLEA
jgi:putative transposase